MGHDIDLVKITKEQFFFFLICNLVCMVIKISANFQVVCSVDDVLCVKFAVEWSVVRE